MKGCTRCSSIDRLLARISLDQATGCWLWTGPAGGGRNGRYGRVWFDGRTTKVHLMSYRLFKGTVPKGRVVMHSCDTPLCCNPAHLVAGTLSQNMRDCARKGRHPALFRPKSKAA
jgi:hypothetical protein